MKKEKPKKTKIANSNMNQNLWWRQI